MQETVCGNGKFNNRIAASFVGFGSWNGSWRENERCICGTRRVGRNGSVGEIGGLGGDGSPGGFGLRDGGLDGFHRGRASGEKQADAGKSEKARGFHFAYPFLYAE